VRQHCQLVLQLAGLVVRLALAAALALVVLVAPYLYQWALVTPVQAEIFL